MHYSAASWIFFGALLGGDFFRTIISNDLVGAFGHADSTNQYLMIHYATWLYNDCPSNSWREKNLKDWKDEGGLIGQWRESGELSVGDMAPSARRRECQP
jgi:hypothetical protein